MHSYSCALMLIYNSAAIFYNAGVSIRQTMKLIAGNYLTQYRRIENSYTALDKKLK